MTRYILVVLVALMATSRASGCDACGCSIMGQSNGLLSAYRKSFLSLGYGHTGFSAVPGSGEGSVDAFQVIDLSFDYYFSDRLRAGVFIPLRRNTRTLNQAVQRVEGIADIRMDINYTFFKKETQTTPFEIYLDAGLGVILPTGEYDPDIHDQQLPENFNTGNGSFGFSLQQTSGFSYRSFGAVLKNTWSDYMKTSNGYEYGAQWVTSLLLLTSIPIDSVVSVVPLGSIHYEKVWSDAYATGADVHGTGGYGVFASAGCQLKINRWLCSFQYSVPLADHYSNGEVTANNRYTVQFTHLF